MAAFARDLKLAQPAGLPDTVLVVSEAIAKRAAALGDKELQAQAERAPRRLCKWVGLEHHREISSTAKAGDSVAKRDAGYFLSISCFRCLAQASAVLWLPRAELLLSTL